MRSPTQPVAQHDQGYARVTDPDRLRSGPFTTWAQTRKIDGRPGHGRVYAAFWRSGPDGGFDRELVLRLTATLAACDELKKVVNSIRHRIYSSPDVHALRE